jgi:putative addiction module killer protein
MKSEWEVQTYDIEKFEKWFKKLKKEGKVDAIRDEILMLEKLGNKMSMPHSKNLGNKLYELRESYYGLRVYYTFKGNKIILLLNGGDKSTQDNDIKKALRIIKKLD